MSNSVSITQRIKIFNKIYKEFHDELDMSGKLKYDKIKKFNTVNEYNKQISENINMVIEKNVQIISNVKLLAKYSVLINNKINENMANKDVIFSYIKNLYYITFENKQDADSISAMLDMNIDSVLGGLFNSGENNKLMKFAMDLAEEIKPIYSEMNIENLEGIDIQSLIQDAMKGNINVNNISKNLSDSDKEKIERLITIIKEKITSKIESGELNINELKKALKKSLKL